METPFPVQKDTFGTNTYIFEAEMHFFCGKLILKRCFLCNLTQYWTCIILIWTRFQMQLNEIVKLSAKDRFQRKNTLSVQKLFFSMQKCILFFKYLALMRCSGVNKIYSGHTLSKPESFEMQRNENVKLTR
jgi:hypothetical protein